MMSDDYSRPNFLEASIRKERKVQLGREVVSIKQLPFIKFLKFDRLYGQLSKESDVVKSLDIVWQILELSIENLEQIRIDQLEFAFAETVNLNISNVALPWQYGGEDKGKNKQQAMTMEADIEYDGRFAASIVATLSSQFGWSASEVMYELTYDAVICFVQEALLKEHDREEFLYTIASDIGLKKVGDDYIKEPFPKPSWMRMTAKVNPDASKKSRDKRFEPSGVIHDYTNWEKTGKVEVLYVEKDGTTTKKDVG